MDNQEHKHQYDVASISQAGQEKRVNHVQRALWMSKVEGPSGQFVRVFADIFLKREAGKRSYF
ncbi:MAG: hypothetical protein JW873_03860 [Candidatus Saganbacteria bacterium]|nr:hypothetical protein [Candidatus Saganbacteria bacterium]